MKITPKIVAAAIGGSVEGDDSVIITGFAPIEAANPGCITFLANPKYTHHIYTTLASVVIVAEDFVPEQPVNATLIRVADPYSALALLMQSISKMQPQPIGIETPSYIAEDVTVPEDAYIGAFAYIGKGVTLGHGVKIYPQTYIGEGTSIGDDTIIRAGAKIYERCVIGKRCIIHSGAVIGADGFGFAPSAEGYIKIPQMGNVVIEDDVEVGANTTIDRATFGHTKIGHGTKLDNLIQIAHNVEIGTDNVFAAQTGIAGSTHIGNSNRVGGQCGFAGHINVGNNNEFGAQSGIPNHVGDNNRLIGYPAIDARKFARNHVYINRLDSLFKSMQQHSKPNDRD